MADLTFRPSRIKAIGIAVCCAAAAVMTWFALGDESTFSAISKGGLLAKIGIANAIFVALALLALLKALVRPTTLKINTDGVSEVSPLGRFECQWKDIIPDRFAPFARNRLRGNRDSPVHDAFDSRVQPSSVGTRRVSQAISVTSVRIGSSR